MQQGLTSKQQCIYDYLRSFIAQYGYPPSVREIADAVGLRSPSTVHFHLKALEEAGVIARSSGKTRAIMVVEDRTPMEEEPSLLPTGSMIPIAGEVAAGPPIWADQVISDYVPFDLHGSKEEHYALRIRGESMIDANIFNGDIVVVRRRNYAENGDVVIALLDNQATCKRFYRHGNQCLLKAENPAYQDIDGHDAVILGKVVGVVREY